MIHVEIINDQLKVEVKGRGKVLIEEFKALLQEAKEDRDIMIIISEAIDAVMIEKE